MKIGDRVKVISGREYQGDLVGETGTVYQLCNKAKDRAGIRFANRANLRSTKGVFWIDLNHLEKIESEETVMLNNCDVAIVEFFNDTKENNGIPYALYDSSICAGTTVAVKTGHHGFALAQVVEVRPKGSTPVEFGREVVAPVDFTAYYKRQACKKELAELKSCMDTRVKELQSTALYEMLAEKDAELASMLHRYNQLMQEGQV